MNNFRQCSMALLTAFASFLALSASVSASAQTYSDTILNPTKIGFGNVGSVGNINVSASVSASPFDLNITTPSLMLTDKNLRYGLKLRYQAAPNIALEAIYSDLRAFNNINHLVTADPARATAKSYGLDLVSTLPIMDRLFVTGRAGVQGVQSVRGDGVFSGLGIDSNAGVGPRLFSQARFGLGVQYSFTKSVGLRLEVERFYRLSNKATSNFGSDFSSDNVSLGVQFKF